jgi:uncharacterized membrane protein YeaQ/YmgE (transglycosylase-associated protein family)
MLGQIVSLALIGAAAGWIATKLMDIRLDPLRTVLLGAAGAVVSGLALKVVLPVLLSLIGAVAGACLVIWLVERNGAGLRRR